MCERSDRADLVKCPFCVCVGDCMGFFGRKSKDKGDALEARPLVDAIPTLTPAVASPPERPVPLAPKAETIIAPVADPNLRITPQDGATPTEQAATQLSPEDLAKHKTRAKQVSAAFGEIVTLMMRSPRHKHLTLAELEHLIVPALRLNQFSIMDAQSKTTGQCAPICAVLWAKVSADIHGQLATKSDRPFRLQPRDWNSGEIIQIVETVGDERAMKTMLANLSDREWKQKPQQPSAELRTL